MSIWDMISGRAAPAPAPTPAPVAKAPPPKIALTPTDLDTLVRTMLGEARGQPLVGQMAVAHTIFNRVTKKSGQFLKDTGVAVACKRPYQFSCWNANDPNSRVITGMKKTDVAYGFMTLVATHAAKIYNEVGDLVGGATHYYAPAACQEPSWARGLRPSVIISDHRFYAHVA